MPFFEPNPPATQSQLRVALDPRVVRREVPRLLREVLDRDVLELRRLADEELGDGVRVRGESGLADAYSSIRLKREPSSATTSRRQMSAPPVDRARDPYVERLLELDALRDVDEQAVLPDRRVVRGELLVPADERVEPRVVLASGSNRMPSGARSISIPASVTSPSPATSSSRLWLGGAPGSGVGLNASGSNPRRSVNRQASSGRGDRQLERASVGVRRRPRGLRRR